MKQRSKNILITLISVILLCALTAAAVMYAEGKFDKAPETTEALTERISTDPVTTDPPETQSQITLPATTAAVTFDIDEHEKLLSNYGVMSDSFSQSEALYDPGSMKLLRLTSISLPDSDDENDVMTKTKYIVTYKGNERSFAAEDLTENRRAVDVYMGMIVVSDKGSLSFYNGNGELLYECL